MDKKSYKIKIALRNRPLADLGGDFIDIGNTPNGCDLIVADVAGHDMGSSFHTVLIKAFFEENCRKGNDGITLFNLLNQQLMYKKQNERMITGVFIRLDLLNKRCYIVSAAHPPVVFIQKESGASRPVFASGDVLGMHEEVEFQSSSFDIAPGDRLVVHTDGVTNASFLDTKVLRKKRLKFSGLQQLIANHKSKNLLDMIEDVWQDLLEYCGKKPVDDMLLLGVEIPKEV